MRQRMVNMMHGRYGIDSLSNFLMIFACVLVFANIFIRNNIVNTLGLAMLIYAYYRVFSKNISRRSAENSWFLGKTYRVRRYFYKKRDIVRLRRTHHIYRCPKCRQRVKVPRGKGKIAITCPKCRNEFVRRS